MERKEPVLIPWLRLVLFVVCPILFFTDLTRNPFYTQIAILHFVMPLCWIVWLWQGWKDKELLWRYSALDIPFIAFIAVCLASWLLSFATHRDFVKSVYSEGSRGMVFLLVNCYLVYAAALRTPDVPALKRLVIVAYIVSAIVSVYGLCQYCGIELVWPQHLNPYGTRPVSTFGNPNFMSSFLVLMLPVLVADYALKFTGIPRFFIFAILFSSAGALIATLTRSSWVGGAVGIAIVLIGIFRSGQQADLKRLSRAFGILAVCSVLAIVFWPKGAVQEGYNPTIWERLTEVKSLNKGSYAAASQRMLIWLSAWHMIEDHPILGKGWGTFELFYPFYQGPNLYLDPLKIFRTHANNAHNEFLENWTQAGAVGLGLVILLWIIFFRSALSMLSRLAPGLRALALGFSGGVAGMLVDNLLNVSVHFAVPAFFFWWWVGSLFVLDPEARKLRSIPISSPRSRTLVALASIGLLCLMGRSVCLWAEEINFFDGFKLSKGNVDLAGATRALETAYAFHRGDVNNAYELANVYARAGRRDDALAMYTHALEANPGYDEIHYNRATVLLQMGREPDAIAGYEMALRINPLSREAYNALSSLYMKDLKKYGAKAETLFRNGLVIYPSDKDLWNNYGYLLTQEHKDDEAYAAFHKALEIDPGFDLSRKNLMMLAPRLKGKGDDPLLSVDKQFSEIDALIDHHRNDEAAKAAEELVKRMPQYYRTHFYLGNVNYSRNHIAEAIANYQEAVRLRPELTSGWQNLAISYARLGRNAEARSAANEILKVDPNNALAKKMLATFPS